MNKMRKVNSFEYEILTISNKVIATLYTDYYGRWQLFDEAKQEFIFEGVETRFKALRRAKLYYKVEYELVN